MRAYFFGNCYLSTLQQGVQAAHVLAEIMREYEADDLTDQRAILYDWAEKHKTIILLNGGNALQLQETVGMLEKTHYPFSYFNESETALGGILTSAGVILPEPMCDAIDAARRSERNLLWMRDKGYIRWNDGEKFTLSEADIVLIARIADSALAR